MIYYYKCFERIIKLTLDKEKLSELDFWLQRFCPNIKVLKNCNKYDISIECIEDSKQDYIILDNNIKLYGKMDNYSSYLAKFITQVFQKILIKDNIIIVPAACVSDGHKSILIIGDFWQGKTSTALNIAKKYNLKVISDNYIAIKNSHVIGATKYISKREEDIDNKDSSLLKVNNRYFYDNLYSKKVNELLINGFLLPFINNSDNNIHLISKEESKWYLYQKFIRLLSGETILFNGSLPSPTFLDKESSKIILSIVNELLNNRDILYVSSSMDVIIEKAIEIFGREV